MKGTVLRGVSGGIVAAALMLVVALPASAAVTPLVAPTLEVSTPDIGAYFRRGAIWVTGLACDSSAASSDTTAGIARVSVFAGNRDDPTAEPATHNGRGGYLGSASLAGTLSTGTGIDMTSVTGINSRLGLGNPAVSICKNPNAGWRVLTTNLKKGAYRLQVFALGKNGAETMIMRDIRVDQP
jgi:hypothetical protein